MEAAILPLVVGSAIGIVVGLLGAGGGILSVPALLYLLNQTHYVAAIGSLLGITLTSAGSFLVHARAGNVRVASALTFGGLSVLSAFVGARISLFIDDQLLLRIFSIFLVIVGIAFAARTVRGGDDDTSDEAAMTRRDWANLTAVASATGLITGIFGVGGGFMIVPALVFVMKVAMREAVGTSLLVMVMTSLAGIGGRLPLRADMDLQLIGLFVAGSVAGGLLGSVLSKTIHPRLLTGLFSVLVTGVGIYSAIESWT